jgi:hypothetical protein
MEWQVFMDLEPPADLRMGWLAASIRQTMVELRRDSKKRPQPFKVEEFLLRFGDESDRNAPTRGRQTWQSQKAMLFAYAKEMQRGKDQRSRQGKPGRG